MQKIFDNSQLKILLSKLIEWCQAAIDKKADKINVLTKDNNTEYVPTNDYSPSTKKYVDDSLSKHVPKTMVGATDSTNGTSGTVPAPTISDKDKFLKGDGTWGEVSSGKIVTASTAVTEDGTAIIANPLSESISDSAMIYQNGILIQKEINYNINSDGNIELIDYTAYAGDIFTIVSNTVGANISLSATGANIALINTGDYFDSTNNVEDAIQKIGATLNGGVVSGLRVNGEIATPDSNGVVDVASPTIRLNGTNITPDENGVVDINNVVSTSGATMTGNLKAASGSTGNYVRNISYIAEGSELPSTGSDGDIILVYSND